jgi:mucin-19
VRRSLVGCLLATSCLTTVGWPLAMSTPGRAAEAPKWLGHVEVVARPNSARSSGAVELFLPISQGHDALVFVDARLSASEDSELFGNLGLALRRIISSDAIIGASVFFDHTRSEHGRSYHGVTFGLEALTEALDARVNFHAPLTGRKVLDFKAPIEGGTLSLQNLRLVEQLSEAGFIRHEIPHYGVEGEVGAKLPIGLPDHSALRVFAGGYHYWASGMEDITGVSGRIEFETRDLFGDLLPGARLTLAGLVRHDEVRDTEFGGEVRLRLPFGAAPPSAEAGGRSELTPIEQRMTTRIVRETEILTRTRTRALGSGSGGTRLAINPETGEPYGRIVFADGANTLGAGSPEDPTTLDDAVARASSDGIVVAEGSAGPLATGGVTLAQRMALLGGGGEIPVLLSDGSIVQFGLGSSAGTIQGIGAVNVITLADGARLENITITGGQTAVAGRYYRGDVTLRNVTVSGTSGDAISIASATGQLTFQGVSILDSGGDGLALSGNSGLLTINDLIISRTAGHGISAVNNANLSIQGVAIGEVGGDGINVVNNAGTNLLSASQVTVARAAGAGISVDGSAGGTTIVTSFAGNAVQQAGAGGVLFETVSFDADPDAGGFQPVAGGNLLIGNPAAPGNIGGDGLRLNEVVGAIAFDTLQIANEGGTGLFVRDSCGKVACPPASTFSLSTAGGGVNTGSGTPIDLDPVIVDITLASVAGSGGTHGILLDTVDGTFTVTGPVTINDVSMDGVAIVNSSGNFSFGNTTIGDAGGAGISIQDVSGTVSFGATQITDVAGTAIALASNPATVTFGATTITGPGGTGIDIEGAHAAVTFGATMIAGLGAATGVDLTDGVDPTQVALTFATLDIFGTGAAGSIGIDYSGSTNSADVVTLDSGTIQGVDVGVDLSNASATGLFQYGDGSNADADGAASAIQANTPLVIAGLNAANGIYDFLDVFLDGDTSNLVGVSVFYVDVDGTGIGTADDPGSLAGAMASGADVIALVNTQNGAADLIDANDATQGTVNTLSLADHQQLVSFAAASTINVGGAGAPANLLLFGITPGQITDPTGFGAPILTTTNLGSDTVDLGDGNILQGLVIANGGGADSVGGSGISGMTLFQTELTAGLSLTNSTGDANLNQSTLTTLAISGGSVDVNVTDTSLTNAAGGPILTVNGGHIGEVSFDATSSITATGGGGLVFNGADGTYEFLGITTLDGVANGIDILGGSDGAFMFGANTSITSPTGTAFNLSGGTADVTFSGNITQANNAVTVNVEGGHSGTLTFETGTIHATNGDGLRFDDADGTYNFVGTTMLAGGDARIAILAGSDGTFTFAASTIANPGGTGIAIANNAADVSFTGTTTINSPGAHGVVLTSTTGTIAFDTLSITNPGLAAIDMIGTIGGPVSFGELIIALQTANSTGLDLSGATIDADVTASDFDSTSTTAVGTVGVRLVDTVGTGTVRLGTVTPPFDTGPDSTIVGVHTGVLFSSGTNFRFTFGDGEAAVDVDSRIDAVRPIAATDSLPVNGIYNFLDVLLVGDTSNLSVDGDVYFVDEFTDGIDDGTSVNPGTLAGAQASGADFIVLVNNGTSVSPDTIDAASASQGAIDTFSLADGQWLISFLNGDAVNVGTGGAPASFQLTGITPGEIVNPNPGSGAPNLTTTALGANVVNLADGNVIDGIVITASAGAGHGIAGVDTLDASIRNSQIGATESAIFIDTTALATSTVTISGVTATSDTTDAVSITATDPLSALRLRLNDNIFSGTGGFGLLVNGDVLGDRRITIEQLANNTVVVGNGSAGMSLSGIIFDAVAGGGIDTVNGGTTILGAGLDRLVGDGLVLANVAGDLAFDQLDIFNDGGTGLLVQNSKLNTFLLATGDGTIDTTGGTALDLDPLTIDMILTSLNASGGANGVNLVDVDGSLTIQGGSISNTTDVAFNISGGSVDATFAGDITQTSNSATINVAGGHTGTLTFQTGTISATNGSGLQFDDADGTYDFLGTTTLAGGDAGIDILNGSAGTFDFGTGTTITDPSGAAFNLADSNANVTFSGNISANNHRAVVIDNGGGFVTFQTGAISSIGPSALGILVNASSGTVSFNGETQLDTGANDAVTLTNNVGGTISFNATGNGLDIVTTTGAGFSATGEGTVNVGGAGNTITSGAGIALNLNTVATSSGITFSSVTKDGAGSGIVLSDVTGAGAVTVTGNVSISNATTGISVSGGTAGVSFNGTTTISDTGTGVALNDTAGTVTFNVLSITNPSAGNAAIDIDGTIAAAIDLGDVDIALQTDNSIGLDLSGATIEAAITADDFDVDGNGNAGTLGIDLTGTMGAGPIQLGDPSTTTRPARPRPSSTSRAACCSPARPTRISPSATARRRRSRGSRPSATAG